MLKLTDLDVAYCSPFYFQNNEKIACGDIAFQFFKKGGLADIVAIWFDDEWYVPACWQAA